MIDLDDLTNPELIVYYTTVWTKAQASGLGDIAAETEVHRVRSAMFARMAALEFGLRSPNAMVLEAAHEIADMLDQSVDGFVRLPRGSIVTLKVALEAARGRAPRGGISCAFRAGCKHAISCVAEQRCIGPILASHDREDERDSFELALAERDRGSRFQRWSEEPDELPPM